MRSYVEGFNQEALVKYKLNPSDALILQWFKSFSLSGKQKYIDRKENRYYWVKYSKVIEDLPCLYISNPVVIGRIFQRLSAPEMPLEKLRANVNGIQEIYFRFRPEILQELECSDMKLLEEVVQKPKEKLKNNHRINPNIMTTLEDIKCINLPNKDLPLFSFSIPEDPNHYTKSIKAFQDKLLSLYTGNFLREYPISEKFLKRNEFYITKETNEKIRACKGSWNNIYNLLLQSARHYRKWFCQDKEPANKSWLTRDISNWIYSPHNQYSLFYICIVKYPSPLREVNGEKLYNSIAPPELKRIAENLLWRPEFDAVGFWSRIKSVIRWYKDNVPRLARKDTGVLYWIGNGIEEWFENYCRWILELTDDKPWLSNLGTNCPTWRAWLTYAQKNHGIEELLNGY